jgi:carbon monoxide dehydrogenase subunit G
VIIEGQFTVKAPRDRVWAAIWDIPTLAGWVPGCMSAERISETDYRARLEQQVGFLKASFDLLLSVVETEPPTRILLHGEGEDRRLRSNIRVDSEVTLGADDGATVLRYRHDLSVFGRLGALGFPVIQRKAREIEAEFARRATASLAGDRFSAGT